MSSIYEIDQAILACMDADTGEVIDIEGLEALSIERDKKLESIALYIKNIEAEAVAIKSEEQVLAERRKVKENKAKRLREYLSDSLAGQSMETPRVRLSFKKSSGVEISDSRVLLEYLEVNSLDDCIKYKAPEISKSEVGELLKTGVELPGVELVNRNNLQIK